MKHAITGLALGLLAATLTIFVVIILCLISGKSFVAAMGFPLTWPLFSLLTLMGWAACLLRIEKE